MSLVSKDKPAVLIYTHAGQFGYEKDDGKWQALKTFEANTWYALRVEVNVKDKVFSVFIDNNHVGDANIKFRNPLGEINGWMAGTSAPQVGTMFISSIVVSTP